MPPPPPPNVYPCLDWVPQGVAKNRPERLKLSREELKTVIKAAKTKAVEDRRRLGRKAQDGGTSNTTNDATTTTNNNNNDYRQGDNKESKEDEDDIIMKEYGLENYDDEDGEFKESQSGEDAVNEMSEDEDDEDIPSAKTTRGPLRGLAEDIAALTYHASNDEDPYLKQSNVVNEDDEDDEELTIKPTDNLIVAGHVNKEDSSIEVYIYDNDQNEYYLHHDIIQSDYPCCVKWVGHVRNQSRNIAAVGYMNPDICLWDLDVIDVLEPLEILTGHTDAVIDISWNHQVRNIIASGSADRHVRLWDLNECRSISNIKLTGKVSALEFGIFEQFSLLAGDLNRHVSLIDTRTSSKTNSWKLLGEVEKVRWIPIDHSKFLASDDQGYIYFFDLRSQEQPIMKFRAHRISVTGLEFSPKCEDMLVTASADETVKVWDTKTAFRGSGPEPTLVKEIDNLNVGSILSLRMCPNSVATIAVGGDSKCNPFSTFDLMSEKEVNNVFVKSRLTS